MSLENDFNETLVKYFKEYVEHNDQGIRDAFLGTPFHTLASVVSEKFDAGKDLYSFLPLTHEDNGEYMSVDFANDWVGVHYQCEAEDIDVKVGFDLLCSETSEKFSNACSKLAEKTGKKWEDFYYIFEHEMNVFDAFSYFGVNNELCFSLFEDFYIEEYEAVQNLPDDDKLGFIQKFKALTSPDNFQAA